MPDPTELIDYNRYAYSRANPLRYNDPSGHCTGPYPIWCSYSSGGGASGSTPGLGQALVDAATGGAAVYTAIQTADNLSADRETYVTPATPAPGPIVLQDPVAYANQVQVTGIPLDSGDLPTIPPPMQPVGITTQQLVTPLPVQQAGSNIIVIKPLGRGSTGKSEPDTLNQQLALEQAISNPSVGLPIPLKKGMTDPRWPAGEGWIKMSQNINGIEIHYVYNPQTGESDDFKMKK